MESPSIDSGVNKAPYTLTVHFPTMTCFSLFCSDFMDMHYFFWGVIVRIMRHIMHFTLQY